MKKIFSIIIIQLAVQSNKINSLNNLKVDQAELSKSILQNLLQKENLKEKVKEEILLI